MKMERFDYVIIITIMLGVILIMGVIVFDYYYQLNHPGELSKRLKNISINCCPDAEWCSDTLYLEKTDECYYSITGTFQPACELRGDCK